MKRFLFALLITSTLYMGVSQKYQQPLSIADVNVNTRQNPYLLWNFSTGGWVDSSPALGDMNGDGKLDVVV
ncbi:MAG: VCBS repeat-containing protein, partial [Candidatus Korarchaeota archaeon]